MPSFTLRELVLAATIVVVLGSLFIDQQIQQFVLDSLRAFFW
jgi:hypothetical protein